MSTTPATSFCSNTPFPERHSSRSSSASEVTNIYESRPVLGEGAIDETNGTEGDVGIVGESRRKRVSEKLRRILVVCLMVLLIVFAGCAYSMVGPFLPIEVCCCMCCM